MSNLTDFIGGAPAVWVTGTTYAAGKVVWSPSDYQYYMRKTAGAGATDPASDTTNWQPTGSRAIKSIQRGTVTTNGTVTVTAVNPAKSILSFLGFSAAGVDNTYSPRIVLTNSTTITSTSSVAGSVVSWELVEYY